MDENLVSRRRRFCGDGHADLAEAQNGRLFAVAVIVSLPARSERPIWQL